MPLSLHCVLDKPSISGIFYFMKSYLKCKAKATCTNENCLQSDKAESKKGDSKRQRVKFDTIVNLDGEIWKDIPQYEGLYQASSFGRIKTVERYILKADGKISIIQERIRKTAINNGYYKIMLSANGRRKAEWVHRLIAKTFIPNPYNKPQVNHKFGIKTDNRASELEWATYAEDRLHAENVLNHKWGNGIRHRGVTHVQSKKVKQIDINTNKVIKIWDCVNDAFKDKVASNISMCASGKLKTSGGYKWEYVK
jgi:hypothetical protein